MIMDRLAPDRRAQWCRPEIGGDFDALPDLIDPSPVGNSWIGVASSGSMVGLARTGAVEGVGAERLTLEGLFRQHADDVHRIVRRLLGLGATEADVDDLVQQVFLAVHRALPSFRGESKTSTWIYGIASRTVLNHLRSWRRYRVMVARLEEDPWPVERPDRQLESRDELRRVWRCLMRIKAKK